jgi:N-methylhydantoinase B
MSSPASSNLERGTRFDPITIEIIQTSLQSISDEMFATMRKTAMSSIIYEVLDFGVCVTDAHGELASSGSGIPAFVGMLDRGVKAVIEKHGRPDGIRRGDIFATNVPHRGGVSHLNDVTLMLPVFADGELIAWVANKAHWVDMGGMSPGSINPQAIEIFQEGLQLPEIRLFENGEPISGVMDILMANVRLPETTRGDLWAGVASMRAGEKRILELAAKYGKDAVVHAIQSYMDYAHAVSRSALKGMPKGTFGAEDRLDDGRSLVVKVTISEDEFVVDLRGNPAQDSGPFNASFAATCVDAQMVFKAVTSPETPANAGSFRPLKVLCDPKTICNAEFPGAMGLYYEVGIRFMDLIWKALAPVMPERLSAGHYASICGTIIGGVHPDTGRPHSFIEPEIGGWGAAAGMDGDHAQYTGFHGDTFNCPAEINEARNGVMIDRYELNPESGGEGEFRGGKGIYLDYRIRSDNWWLTAMYSRSTYGPWGMRGGRNGSTNYLRVIRKDGSEERLNTCTGLKLNKDDIVRVVTANGGGFGDPHRRPNEKVLEDLRNGYITLQQARDVYGVQC